MNWQLKDPFASTIPDRIDATLEFCAEQAHAIALNGRHVAVAYAHGPIAIFQLESLSVASLLPSVVAATTLSWKGSWLLAGAAGNPTVQAWNVKHARGICNGAQQFGTAVTKERYKTFQDGPIDNGKEILILETQVIREGEVVDVKSPSYDEYPAIQWDWPAGVGGSLELKVGAGLATLQNDRLVLFYISDKLYMYELARDVLCAAFQEDTVHAVSKRGTMLSWDTGTFWRAIENQEPLPQIPLTKETLKACPSPAWQMVVCGSRVLCNTADGSLRVFHPKLVLRDVVSKVRFASCAHASEYIVGGANANDDAYDLYIWNPNGVLLDKLHGPPGVSLYALAVQQDTILVVTSDGLVDVWRPPKSWMRYCPDFQALPRNIQYIEQEDEFDKKMDGSFVAKEEATPVNEDEPVNVLDNDEEDPIALDMLVYKAFPAEKSN